MMLFFGGGSVITPSLFLRSERDRPPTFFEGCSCLFSRLTLNGGPKPYAFINFVQPARELVMATPALLASCPCALPASLPLIPASALIKVDLPTLERPRRQTSGIKELKGRLRKRGDECRNLPPVKRDFARNRSAGLVSVTSETPADLAVPLLAVSTAFRAWMNDKAAGGFLSAAVRSKFGVFVGVRSVVFLAGDLFAGCEALFDSLRTDSGLVLDAVFGLALGDGFGVALVGALSVAFFVGLDTGFCTVFAIGPALVVSFGVVLVDFLAVVFFAVFGAGFESVLALALELVLGVGFVACLEKGRLRDGDV